MVKIFARNGGWAELDATKFHFAIIDYFVINGFNWDYPQVAPMYPGMHAFFAIIARVMHLGPILPTDWASFTIQSVWGVMYVVSTLMIVQRVHALAPFVERPLLLLILLCSSYPIASWIWPTTELGAYASMYGLLALSLGRVRLTLWQALLFAAFAACATLFRQNYAVFAIAPLAIYSIACVCRRADFRLGTLAIQILPLGVVGVIVAAFTLKWGGLIAPEMARAGMVSAFQIAQLENLIGLIGLIGFPFVILAVKSVSANRRDLIGLAGLSVVAAVAVETIWPMMYDHAIGHFGSLIWLVVLQQDALHLGHLPLMLLLALGFFVLFTLVRQCLADRFIEPELVLFGLFVCSLMPQSYVFQRYSEVAFLSILAIVFLRRAPVTGHTRSLFYAWFGIYAFISFIRPVVALTGLSG